MKPSSALAPPAVQRPPLTIALAILGCVAIAGQAYGGWRHMLLPVIGFAAGFALYRSSLGFASAWRNWLTSQQSLGVRAQLIMIGLAVLVFFPLLEVGTFGGHPLGGFVNPVGFALCFGAFLFGVGMQLGGGCGSGTLYTAGGGNVRMLATLLAFIAGSVLATTKLGGWDSWPAAKGISIIEWLGAIPAISVVLIVLCVAYRLLVWQERRYHGKIAPLLSEGVRFSLRAHWPLLSGVLVLVAVNTATLLVSGRPWGITSAFALWGGKIVAATGVDVISWPYWQDDSSLSANVFADATSLTNFGLMLGAFAAAALAGAVKPNWRVPPRMIAASIFGGMLMGYGARLATGCNIGAFFSGISSGSLHGVVWLLFALPGNAVGIRLRTMFGR